MRYLVFIIALFAALQTNAQNNIVYGAGINYTNGAPTFTPPVRTSRVAIDTVTGKWYHFNTPGGWQLIGNTIEEIAGCTAPAYTPGKGDSKVVINNCSPQPELYFYNGSAWVLVGGGSVYAGEGIRIENDTIILDSLYVLRFRTGDTTDLNAGAVSWNTAEQTLDVVINQGAVTGQMFQEVLYFTKNQTGAQIDDGTVVMAAGTTGNSGKILIAPAIADGSVNSEYILGLATQNLPNGAEGMVTHFGKVRGIQTNGANFGETWVDGDVLYCSAATPGYLTKVLPTAPNLKIPIAIVIHAHPSNGTLFVRPSHFPDLAQINDVELSSPTNGQVLTYNSTLSRWENATPANQLQTLSTDNTPGNISISSGNTITLNVNDADASATNELQTLSTGTNTLTLSNGGGTVTVDTDPTNDVTGSGASGQVSFWTGSQTQSGDNGLFWDNSLKDLGIGTNAPSSTLDVIGNVEFQNPTTLFDAATIGAELLTTGTGTNWTGTGYSTGYLHAVGSTDPLTSAFTPVAANYYVVVVTVSGRTTGSISFTFGTNSGTTISSNITQTNYWVAGSTGKLIITPTIDFNGTVVASVTQITQSTAQFTGRRSDGSLVLEQRMSSINSNIFLGLNAGRFNLTGGGNVFLGLNAGSRNTTGSSNIFMGSNSGLVNTTGSNNVFMGNDAGTKNTTGIENFFQGYLSGQDNTTGSLNVFTGSRSGTDNTTGGSNVFQGYQAGANNTTGSFNTFLGTRSGIHNLDGSNNITLGYYAARYIVGSTTNNTKYDNSIAIGTNTRFNNSNQTNQIVIGHLSEGLGSNTTVLGNSSTTQTWLGGSLTLGTQVAPAARLHVVGSGASSSTWTAQFHNSGGANNALMIRDDGNVGIGTNAPTRQLTVAGDAQINNRRIGLGTGNTSTNTFFAAGVGPNFTGNNTVAVGSMELPNITTAVDNTLIGASAGNNLTTGGSNTYIGRSAGSGNLTETGNFAMGAFSLLNHNAGNFNIAIGFDAGRRISTDANMTNSENSIMIGRNTRPLANGNTNQIIIGHTSLGLGSNTTVLGNSSTTQTWLGGSLTLGTQVAPAARLHVVGSGTSSSTWTAQFHNASTGGNNALMIRDDGNVGIGTSTMTGTFNVNSNGGWGIYTTGTSNNFMSTKLGIGATDLSSSNLRIGSNLTGSIAPAHVFATGTVQSDATAAGIGFYSRFGTASGWTLPNLVHFYAEQGTLNNTVTNQFGFSAGYTIIGATNNFGFYGNIPAGTGRWNFYANGTARNYFAGNTAIGTTTQNASAAFEVASTTQGVLFPRMTTAQRDLIATPADGLVIYNTTDNKLQVRAGGAWVDLH